MTFVFLASSGAPHRADSIHSVAILLIGVHGFLHVWLLRWLTRQAAMGIAAAVAALAAFRDPRRISHIDLGVAWALLATLAPLAGLG